MPVLISVDDLERFADLRSLDQSSAVKAGCDKVLEVDLTVAVDVALFDDAVPVDLVFRSILLTELTHGYSPDVLMTQCAVLVCVKPDELLLQVLHLLWSHAETTKQREDDFLELIKAPVLDQIFLDTARKFMFLRIKLLLGNFIQVISNPGLLKQLTDRWSRVSIAVKTPQNECFCFV